MFCTRNPIFVDRRFNCPRKILKTVLESGRQKEKAILQFCSIFESRVKLFLSIGQVCVHFAKVKKNTITNKKLKLKKKLRKP